MIMTTKGKTNSARIAQSFLFALFCGLLILTASSGNVLAQSTDRDNPTPLAANEVKGYAPGKKVEYYFTFLAGPGDLVITIDSGAKGSFSEFRAELFDMDAERLAVVQVLPYPGETSRRVGRATFGAQQPVLLRLTLDKEAAQYMARIGGAAQFAGTDAAFSTETPSANATTQPATDTAVTTPPITSTTETSTPPVTDAATTTATPTVGKVSGLKKFWFKLSATGEIMGLAGIGSLRLEMKDGTAQDISLGKIKKVLVGDATSAPTDGSNITPSGEDRSSGWQRFWLKLGTAGDFTGLSGRPLRLEMKDGTVQEFSPAKLNKVSLKK
jgi:hypothetical protein